MNSFHCANRVRITDQTHEMRGACGTIARRRMKDDGAWVAMESDPPESIRSFPLDDEYGRGRHVLLFPDQCEASDRA